MTQTPLSQQTPPEIDTRLAEQHQRLGRAFQTLAFYKGQEDKGRTLSAYDQRYVDEARAEYHAALDEIRPLDDEFATRGGWSRFFLVQNSGGHIHSSMECHTCYADTQYAWLPSVSGQTEAEAVAEFGEILCSVCFPTAPVEWTTGTSKASQAASDERAAKRAAAAAKRAAKALNLDDIEGGYVFQVDGRTERITTIHAAKAWLTDSAMWDEMLRSEGRHHGYYPPEVRDRLAEILADRVGTTAADELAAAAKRAAKRR